jgi:hypothetical protein
MVIGRIQDVGTCRDHITAVFVAFFVAVNIGMTAQWCA